MVSNAFASQTTRVSVNSDGVPASAGATNGVLSVDGRYVVFQSTSSNLVSGAFGGQVYRHDRSSGRTELVSLSTAGGPGNNLSRDASVSANGRYVVFSSFATDLVTGDANGALMDVFVRDMAAGTTSLVNTSATGVQADLASALSELPGARKISDDGRYVVFLSSATNLVADTNSGRQQVYVKDMTTGAIVRASVSDAGLAGNQNSQAPTISGDGHVVAFQSAATNFSSLSNSTQIFVRDLIAGTTTLESPGAAAFGAPSTAPVVSFDGRYLAFESATSLEPRDRDNGTLDVYLRDRVAGTTVLASLSDLALSGATSAGPAISSDGRWVGFNSRDDTMVGPGNDTNGFADVFLYDRDHQTVTLVSLNDAGQQATAPSGGASVSGDGQLVLFGSTALNLVASPSGSGNVHLYVRNMISNQAPVISPFAKDYPLYEGQPMRLVWEFTDDDASTSWTATVDWNDGSGKEPLALAADKRFFLEHTWAPGTYDLTVEVTDDAGATGSFTVHVVVFNVAPFVNLATTLDLSFTRTLEASGSFTDPGSGSGETYTATVSYGDATGTQALALEGGSFTLSHVYAAAGSYTVAVTVSDSSGDYRTATMAVRVGAYSFKWLDPVSSAFVIGRNLPVKFTVRGPDGSYVLDQSVRVDVVDESGTVVAGPYLYGGQPSRAVTYSGDAYHVNADTKDLAAGMYWLRVTFSSSTLSGELSLGTTATYNAVRSRLRD